jgi:hypothetical protein
MLSLEECKRILNTKDQKYTDEEIQKIRNFLYQLAKADVQQFTISTNGKQKEGNNILTGINY